MRFHTIQARVTAAFMLLVVMALVETAFVIQVQRRSEAALAEAARAQVILLEHGVVARALIGMQAALRGFIITLDRRELAAYDAHKRLFANADAGITPLILDGEQRARFDRFRTNVTEWRAVAEALVQERVRGVDVTARIIGDSSPRFEAARAELDVFGRRQAVLSQEAAAKVSRDARNATLALTLIPLVAVVVIVGLLVATNRAILRPLAAVAQTARRMADGDYDATLPPARGDEIGVLIDSFSTMREAVRSRAAEAAAAQQRLRSSHAELLGVINTVPAALVILNPDGSIRLQNRAAEHLLGTAPVTPEARKTYWQSFAIRDAGGRPMRIRDIPPVRALSGVEVIGEEIDVQREDGRRAIILVGAAPMRDADGAITGAVAGFHDITRLRELDRMKDEFVAIVSHELRTPLTAIRGSLQLLIADEAVADPDNRQLLAVALKSCDRLVRIINDMLDISKIEAGQLKLHTRPLDAKGLVDHAVDSVAGVAGPAGVALTVDVAADLPEINGDPDRLTQALVNLLSNAVKFAPRGSTIHVSAGVTADAVRFSVADQGQGIAPADIERLFKKFQQLDDAGTRRAGGTGLGLSITKAIIEEHGGTISVDSVVGRGTTFTFTVPRVVRASGAAAMAAPRQVTEAARTVLIAGDSDTSRAGLVEAMRAAGFITLEAASPAAAVEMAGRHRIDAIALSMASLGDEDRRALEKLAGDPATSGIPLVVAMEDGALEAGVVKPIDMSDLVSRVKRLLHGRVNATVLVADDDEDLRLVLRETLGRHGFRVIEAADGQDAIDTATRDTIDLVLLDLRMPRVHGHAVIRALRRNPATAQLPIIVLSGSGGERHSLESLVLGANMFLAKPADPSELVREIDRLLRKDLASNERR